MTQTNSSVSDIANASIRRQLLDTRTATKHLSLAAFAHELELVQERFEFGLATRGDVTEVEDRLVSAWRDFIDVSSPASGNLLNMEDSDGSRH
jgi:hypothetical protein